MSENGYIRVVTKTLFQIRLKSVLLKSNSPEMTVVTKSGYQVADQLSGKSRTIRIIVAGAGLSSIAAFELFSRRFQKFTYCAGPLRNDQ